MAKDFDFSGLWDCKFTYINELEPQGGASTYVVKIYRIKNQVVIQSEPSKEENYFIARLSLDENLGILTGTWEEKASPKGRYKGQFYFGAGMLVIDDSSSKMQGKIIEHNNDMKIIDGDWIIKKRS